MEQENQTLFDLMKFTFFTAEVKAHLQSLLQGFIKRWASRGIGIDQQGRDADGRGMPPEPARCADFGFRQRLFEEAVDHEVRA